jgi:hypothetical protein
VSLLALLAASACSGDPRFYNCVYGDVRASLDEHCAVAERSITLDGDAADWDGVPNIHEATCAPSDMCAAGEVQGMQMARFGGTLFTHLTTFGAPDTTNTYGLYFFDGSQDTTRDNDFFADVTPGGTWATMNGIVENGLPIMVAYGATDVEISVPIEALPFPSGPVLVPFLFISQGASLTPTSSAPWIAGAPCWDPTLPNCDE